MQLHLLLITTTSVSQYLWIFYDDMLSPEDLNSWGDGERDWVEDSPKWGQSELRQHPVSSPVKGPSWRPSDRLFINWDGQKNWVRFKGFDSAPSAYWWCPGIYVA